MLHGGLNVSKRLKTRLRRCSANSAPDPYREKWEAISSTAPRGKATTKNETSAPLSSPRLIMSITYLDAIREAQARALAEDPRVFIYGQDVGAFGGAFKATKNLAQQFPGRVMDAPISEDAMVGAAIGAAINGMRPLVEMQFADFSVVGFNQIVNNAAAFLLLAHQRSMSYHHSSACRGSTSGSGPFHSQSLEAIYAHYPGLVVMTPATVEDAYSMLLEAVAIDDPVIFCEHKFLYNHLKAEKLPEESHASRQGQSHQRGPAGDMSIVTYSAMLHEALAVAQELATEGVEVEVVPILALRQAARYRYGQRGIRGSHWAPPLRRRSVALGRRHGGSRRACCY